MESASPYTPLGGAKETWASHSLERLCYLLFFFALISSVHVGTLIACKSLLKPFVGSHQSTRVGINAHIRIEYVQMYFTRCGFCRSYWV